jgi:hypothetical protein
MVISSLIHMYDCRNPSGRLVTYRVRIEGSEFTAERTLVSLPPRGGAQFEVILLIGRDTRLHFNIILSS